MNEENLAESDNSPEEPHPDNQDQLLSLKAEAEETTEPEAMPHLASDDPSRDPRKPRSLDKTIRPQGHGTGLG